VLIYDDRKSDDPVTIFAKTGAIATEPQKKEIRLSLKDGSIHRNAALSDYRLIEFSRYDMSINLNNTSPGVSTDEQDMSFSELRRNIGNSDTDTASKRSLQMEFHKRLSLPFACFVFIVLGIPLGLQNQRAGKAAGFSIGIGAIIFNYILFSIGKNLGQKGLLNPALAMWMPNLILLCIGLYLFKKTADERGIPLLQMIPSMARRIRRIAHGWMNKS
jgi:lipopolysaccharide export system permease protein